MSECAKDGCAMHGDSLWRCEPQASSALVLFACMPSLTGTEAGSVWQDPQQLVQAAHTIT